MKLDWKEGDWCFCEFKLQLIKKTSIYSDAITVNEVSDGHCSHSGSFLNDKCYPLDIMIKRISDIFLYYSDKLHAHDDVEFKRVFPDIYRELVKRWCLCCDDKDDKKKIKKHYSQLQTWYYETVNDIKGLRNIKLKKIENV